MAGIQELADWLAQNRQTLTERTTLDDQAQVLAKDSLLRLMAANVKVIPSGRDFFVEGNESILEASVRAGLHLAYGCASGNCGACKARVVSGEVRKIPRPRLPLSAREREMGYMLACSNTAVTDLVLEAAEAPERRRPAAAGDPRHLARQGVARPRSHEPAPPDAPDPDPAFHGRSARPAAAGRQRRRRTAHRQLSLRCPQPALSGAPPAG